MIRTWKILADRSGEVSFTSEASLDSITRQLPDGYYSTFRTYAECTRVIGLSYHFRRLPGIDASFLRRQLVRLLEQYRPREARVRVILTYQGQLYIVIEPLIPFPKKIYEKGVYVETTSIQRNRPREKSTTFIDQSDKERRSIAEKDVFEALLVTNGRILEGMTSNFFYIHNGVLHTAQRDVLPGVTRRTVIRVARGEGIGVRYKSLKLDQVSAVSEAFLTSSSRGIVPVIQIDDVRVGEGRVGKITERLISGYEGYVLKHAERIDQGT
ncbi:MAG TPA: aminotransferase class IV [Anaerolineales bacterium]|nr:aminotransferase class IV [Anaerolineales bacterium]